MAEFKGPSGAKDRGTPFAVDHEWLRGLKPGDRAVRMLAGVVACDVEVVRVEHLRLTVRPAEAAERERFPGAEWDFCRGTGAEIDEELGWGPETGITGSYLTRMLS